MFRLRRSVAVLFVVALFAGLVAATAVAQSGRGAIRPPEEIRLETKDGVKLAATYYPSNMGKEAVPVVMLHDYKETRTVFSGLAAAMQNPGEGGGDSRAVITVDLRGHGESTVQVGRGGRTRDLVASRLGPADFEAMVSQDMEAVRRFLYERNDAGQLNMNSLCLIGSGMGANVATYWAAVDWAAPILPTLKQGQDVKALVLASPEWAFKGLPLLRPLRQRDVRQTVSMFILYGERASKAKKDAQTVHKNLVKYHPDPPPDRIREEKDLFLYPINTELQGTRLLTDPQFGLMPALNEFIDARISEQHFPWVSRQK